MKIAIVHEWFTTLGGSEKVIEQLLKVFPEADLFSLVDFLPASERGMLGGKQVQTSFLQKAPFINRKNYRSYLPFMPMAVEQLDMSPYNVIISNCHAVSKAVISGPDQLHIAYIHTPLRYAWDMQNAYLENSGMRGLKGAAARLLLHYIRIWDVTAANRADILLANSRFIARRIRKVYRRESRVLFPPVDTDYYTPEGPREDYYFTASRFVPYKRIDLIAQAFREMPDKKLVIIGDGPELARIQPLLGANVSWLGYQPGAVLREHLRRCKAFIFAAREDFGIMPLEAQACGAPVIAFGEGGSLDTVRGQSDPAPSGVFFGEQSSASLKGAVAEFENLHISAEDCRSHALKFSNQRFQQEFERLVSSAWEDFRRESR
jgi:glycosyltransferase involved in cell wall biosynthesis